MHVTALVVDAAGLEVSWHVQDVRGFKLLSLRDQTVLKHMPISYLCLNSIEVPASTQGFVRICTSKLPCKTSYHHCHTYHSCPTYCLVPGCMQTWLSLSAVYIVRDARKQLR